MRLKAAAERMQSVEVETEPQLNNHSIMVQYITTMCVTASAQKTGGTISSQSAGVSASSNKVRHKVVCLSWTCLLDMRVGSCRNLWSLGSAVLDFQCL